MRKTGKEGGEERIGGVEDGWTLAVEREDAGQYAMEWCGHVKTQEMITGRRVASPHYGKYRYLSETDKNSGLE